MQDVILDHPLLGEPVHRLPTPAMLVDLDILEHNIRFMADFFEGRPAKLRPHVKTHRAPAIARLQVAAGANGITAAKVAMAEAMVDGGIDDVYVANQVVSKEAIERLCKLAQRAKVAVLVDNPKNVDDLSEAARAHKVNLDVLIELLAGMERCGVAPGRPALDLTRRILKAPGLTFKGLHAYEGHVVQNWDREERRKKTEDMLSITMETRHLLEQQGIDVEVVTGGGTGTYDIQGAYPGVTENQSGSYVYMDHDYCAKVPGFGMALTVLCTVISRPVPERVHTDGGMQVLASHYGAVVVKNRPELKFKALSEEHGNFLVNEGMTTDLQVGDPVEVVPGHCCACANLHDTIYAVRKGKVEAIWLATARGRSY